MNLPQQRRPIGTLAIGIALIAVTVTLTLGAGSPKKSWPASVKKAFKTIGTKECYDHVALLASDAFEGRAAGEEGGKLASEYIAMRFLENGIAPGGPLGSYFQPFPIVQRRARAGEIGTSNYLRLMKPGAKGHQFDLFDDLTPAAVSGESVTGGELVYLSAARAASHPLPDEFRGKVVILSQETLLAELARPPILEPGAARPTGMRQTLLSGPQEDEPEKKAPPKEEAALEVPLPLARFVAAGVRSILVVTGDKSTEFDEATWPLGERATAARLPVVHLSAKASERLLRCGRSKVEKAEAADNIDFKEWKAFVSVSRMGHAYGMGRNVIGILPGNDPELAEEMIVVGAHFDHIGYAENARMTLGRVGEIHNGADDNASGTSGLIELSEAFATQPKVDRARTLVFIAFDAEEHGLVGSNYYVAHCPHDIEKTVAMLNMDMISRNGPQEMYYGKDGRFVGLNQIVEGVGDYFEIHLDRSGMEKYMDRSDQAAFIARGIPAVFLYGGDHPQYHTEKDDLELINPIKIQNISRFMFLCAYECANHTGKFKD